MIAIEGDIKAVVLLTQLAEEKSGDYGLYYVSNLLVYIIDTSLQFELFSFTLCVGLGYP